MFKDLRIGKKLSVGFGAVLALLLVVGAVAYLGLNGASNGFTAYREMARDNNLAGQLQADMLMVRMNVKDFIITGSDKDLKQYDGYVKKMDELLKVAQVDIQNPKRAEKIDLVDEEVQTYKETFAKVIELKKQRNHYVYNILNKIGPQMSGKLQEIMVSANRDNDLTAAFHAGSALYDLMMARLNVIKFLDTNDQESVENVHKGITEFKEEVATLDRELQNPERRRLLQEILDQQNKYVPAFESLVKVIFERNDLITNTLDKIGPIVAKNVEDVKLDIRAVQDTLGPALVASNRNTEIVILVAAIFALAMGVFLAIYLTKSITQPLAKGVEFAKIVESGDLTTDIEIDQKDEVGLLAEALRNMVSNINVMVEKAKQIAEGDLTISVEARSEKDALALSLQMMVSNLSNIVAEITNAAGQVASGSEQMSSAAQSLSQGATEQASNLEEISSTMNEIESQTKQNADNAKQANQFVTEVRDSAENGTKQMVAMVTAMSEINESSQSISKIIKVIDEIAFQTNLLALNAAVEAARAGQHGKGFAVVAEEVRNLAARSAKAAKETSDLIEGAVKKAEAGTEISQRTESALSEIVSSVTKVSDLVGEISAASVEQAHGVSQVTLGLEQIDKITQQNSAHAEESASSSEELSSQATLLQQTVSVLKISHDKVTNSNLGQAAEVKVSDHSIVQSQPEFNGEEQKLGKLELEGSKRDKAVPELMFSNQKTKKIITLEDTEFGKY